MITPAANRIGSKKRRLRILCVEECSPFAKAFVHLFASAGHDVESVDDGQAAWERLSAELGAFDVLILEHALPRLDGLSLVALLRFAGFPGKIIVHSYYLSAEQRSRYLELSVDFVLTKGMQTPDLFKIVDLLAYAGDAPPAHTT